MKSPDEYLRDTERAHGHLCAGQVLGVRMAMLRLEKLGSEGAHGKDRKRLVPFVEIDRCATDAVAVVTGCRLGKGGNKNEQQMLAYREMPNDDLFTTQWVKVELPPEEFPGYNTANELCPSSAAKGSTSAAK
jgi:formylmethanofuran dehydrogenase subunit E